MCLFFHTFDDCKKFLIQVLKCFVQGKIFNKIPTHKGPIFVFVYPGYTNTERNERKNKINSIHIQEHLILYMYKIRSCNITRKEYTNISHDRIIHISFHEQVQCGRGTKWKRLYLTSVGNIVLWLYRSLSRSESASLLFKQRQIVT